MYLTLCSCDIIKLKCNNNVLFVSLFRHNSDVCLCVYLFKLVQTIIYSERERERDEQESVFQTLQVTLIALFIKLQNSCGKRCGGQVPIAIFGHIVCICVYVWWPRLASLGNAIVK